MICGDNKWRHASSVKVRTWSNTALELVSKDIYAKTVTTTSTTTQ